MSFSPVKALIEETDRSSWPREALIGLKLISPDDPACSGIDREASLTDAAQAQERIRFFLKDRLTRNFRDVGRAWLSAVGPCVVEVMRAEWLDEGSRLFLETLAGLPGQDVEVRFRVGAGGAAVTAQPVKNVREETVDRLFVQVATLTERDLEYLYEQAVEYLSVGDSWTAERILRGIQPYHDVPAVWGRLGLAYTMQDRTLEAEFCYLRWRRDPDPVGVAGADYALSMLYARHHPPHLRSLDLTAEYLEHGYATLGRVAEDDERDLTFHRVFNRNGYALVEFRRGRVDAAIEHLTSGIAQLRNGTALHRMHQTVLIYNLAQCYRRIGRIVSAIDTYRELLGLDGKMPEYHMELAHCHLSKEQFSEALASLREARDLGPSIQEVHSLLGFTFLQLGRTAEALDAYRAALACDPSDVEALYDYAYLLAESGEPAEALRLVARSVDTGRLPGEQAARFLTLAAEQHAQLGDLPAAHAALEEVLALTPDDPAARANLEQVAAAMV
ncbi:tetratricopeptide repeat protein [Streptomyces sp. H28]|uniref:tetratricopeptide repeat protein n=1 Tax=Streptomyces sp. H28 TaxID=2775865 RepID=UPI0017849B97|nr:tetratricopeptide repeat protein [Streptomyces sp. H28]MBD9733044.1 tetratricopeptide repeat protein [Streptomyces sp. H28]